jgi:hypothetical protein
VRVRGVANIDWEDIASCEFNGVAYLVIGDLGDNKGMRTDSSLIIVAEPDPSSLDPNMESEVSPAWRIPVIYPDGPHDCEALAVDASTKTAYIISKRTDPPAVYSLSIEPSADGKWPLALLVAPIENLPQPDPEERALSEKPDRQLGRPTAMDFAVDGSAAVILTYSDVVVYRRNGKEPWGKVFARQPEVFERHNLPQAEAICFSQNSRYIYVTSEKRNQPILRYGLGESQL